MHLLSDWQSIASGRVGYSQSALANIKHVYVKRSYIARTHGWWFVSSGLRALQRSTHNDRPRLIENSNLNNNKFEILSFADFFKFKYCTYLYLRSFLRTLHCNDAKLCKLDPVRHINCTREHINISSPNTARRHNFAKLVRLAGMVCRRLGFCDMHQASIEPDRGLDHEGMPGTQPDRFQSQSQEHTRVLCVFSGGSPGTRWSRYCARHHISSRRSASHQLVVLIDSIK